MALSQVSQVEFLYGSEVGSDELDDTNRRVLEMPANPSILWTDGGVTEWRDGDAATPFALPNLQELANAPRIIVQNAAGEFAYVEPPDPALDESCLPHVFVARDGNMEFETLETSSCWETLCEETPTHFGMLVQKTDCDGNTRWCLTPATIADTIPDVSDPPLFEDSNCIQVVGDGTPANKYRFLIRVSDQPDNCLACLPSGLFSLCAPVYSGIYGSTPDPLFD